MKIFCALAILYLFLNIGAYLYLPKLVFRPISLEENYRYSFEHPYEELRLTSSDGNQISALLFKAQDSQGVVYMLHGNSRNLSYWGDFYKTFIPLGYDFFVIDYQGFGKSDGIASESNMEADAAVGLEYIRRSYDDNEIVLYGRSLGTSMAAYLTSKGRFQLVLLETPFYDLKQLMRKRFPYLLFNQKKDLKFQTAQHLQKNTSPLRIVHGTADKIVPFTEGVKLKPFLKHSDHFITIEGGKHRNLSGFSLYKSFLEPLGNAKKK